MSAEACPIHDSGDPEAWEERTVALVSISPWYRVPTGARVRNVNLTVGNQVMWSEIRKERADSWPVARKKTETAVKEMLQQVMEHVDQLAL